MAEQVKPGAVERASAWVYEGIWGVVSRLFLVPREPPLMPTLGAASGGTALRLKPGEAYLRYRKFWFWIGLTLVDVALIIFWLVIGLRFPIAGALIAVPMLVLIVLPDVLAYIAIHLGYDTTWYVITDRSMRLRSGVWTMHEMTLTFENVQNVEIMQGPVERRFGIATLKVETAGGGSHGQHGTPIGASNVGLLVGLENATQVREWVMQRVRASRSSGLGDEGREAPEALVRSGQTGLLSVSALEELRLIRESLHASA